MAFCEGKPPAFSTGWLVALPLICYVFQYFSINSEIAPLTLASPGPRLQTVCPLFICFASTTLAAFTKRTFIYPKVLYSFVYFLITSMMLLEEDNSASLCPNPPVGYLRLDIKTLSSRARHSHFPFSLARVRPSPLFARCTRRRRRRRRRRKRMKDFFRDSRHATASASSSHSLPLLAPRSLGLPPSLARQVSSDSARTNARIHARARPLFSTAFREPLNTSV